MEANCKALVLIVLRGSGWICYTERAPAKTTGNTTELSQGKGIFRYLKPKNNSLYLSRKICLQKLEIWEV